MVARQHQAAAHAGRGRGGVVQSSHQHQAHHPRQSGRGRIADRPGQRVVQADLGTRQCPGPELVLESVQAQAGCGRPGAAGVAGRAGRDLGVARDDEAGQSSRAGRRAVFSGEHHRDLTGDRGADGGWRLSGEKWFCSAVTSEVAVVLAREDGAPAGSRGLACFVVPRYAEVAAGSPGHAGGTWTTATGLRLHRLKDKLGTRALPSAEVGLDDALAWPVGDPAAPGLPRMMRLVLVTRLHNAAAAALCSRVTSTRRIIRGSPGAAGSPTGQASASSRPTSALGSARVPSLSLSRCRRRPVAVVQVPPAWPGEPAATSASRGTTQQASPREPAGAPSSRASTTATSLVTAEQNHFSPLSRQPPSAPRLARVLVRPTSLPPVASVIHCPLVQATAGSRLSSRGSTRFRNSAATPSDCSTVTAPSVIATGQLYVADSGANRCSSASCTTRAPAPQLARASGS